MILLVKNEYALPIDTNGRCIIAKNVCTSEEIPRYSAKEPPHEVVYSSSAQVNVKFLVIVMYV